MSLFLLCFRTEKVIVDFEMLSLLYEALETPKYAHNF